MQLRIVKGNKVVEAMMKDKSSIEEIIHQLECCLYMLGYIKD